MRYLKYVALLTVLMIPMAYSQAQVRVGIGIGVGPGYVVAGPPACSYGYYNYYPYACAPYGYYGPQYFVDGVFIGTGPWYHWGHPAEFWNRGYWGRDWDRDGWRHEAWEHRGDRERWGREHEGYARGYTHEGYGRSYDRGDFHGREGGGFHGQNGFRGESGFRGDRGSHGGGRR